MMKALTLGISLSMAGLAAAAPMRITEWAYQGVNGEFVEFTNVGPGAVDMTGWSFDDDSNVPGSVDLSAFGIVQPGQSVILTEAVASDFATAWGLSGVGIIGGNTNNLSRNDIIYLYDGATTVDTLAFGDQNFAGTIRTQNKSGITTFANLGANNVASWFFSVVGDAYGTHTSTGGDIGNPGVFVPEPATLALLAIGSLLLTRRGAR